MKIEFDGWTVEDVGTGVVVRAVDLRCTIGKGKLSSFGTPERRAAYNHLEDTFAKTAGVTALDVAAELRAYLKKPKDIVAYGYTVAKDATVTQPDGNITKPVKYKDGYYNCGDKVTNYVRKDTSTTATQADVVAAINRYFEGPREVKGYTLEYWTGGSKRYVCVNGDRLIGHEWRYCGDQGTPVTPAIIAAKEKWAGKGPLLPEVAEFIENWKEDTWHDSTLRCERDDKDNVVIPTPDGKFVRLSLRCDGYGIYAHKVARTAEEAKK